MSKGDVATVNTIGAPRKAKWRVESQVTAGQPAEIKASVPPVHRSRAESSSTTRESSTVDQRWAEAPSPAGPSPRRSTRNVDLQRARSPWDCLINGVCGFGLIRKEMAVTDTTELLNDQMIDLVMGEIIDQKALAERLLVQAKEQGVSLVGPGGLLRTSSRRTSSRRR